jgi:predicted metal-dependent phosphoesterase TrpH
MHTEKGFVDLHIHTSYSDGLLNPQQIVELAQQRRLTAIAITDHDSVAGVQETVEWGTSAGIEVVAGIEISILFEECEVHLLGYFINPNSSAIQHYVSLLSESRENRARQIVDVLKKQGLPISFDLVSKKANGSPIGRPHIAEVLVEEGYVFSAYEAFQKFLGEKRPADIPKFNVGLDRAVEIIKEAGGLVFLAHPATISCFQQLFPVLLDYGLDGIETIHPKHNAELQLQFREIAKAHGLLQSGGSDCHGGRDGKLLLGLLDVPRSYYRDMHDKWLSSH